MKKRTIGAAVVALGLALAGGIALAGPAVASTADNCTTFDRTALTWDWNGEHSVTFEGVTLTKPAGQHNGIKVTGSPSSITITSNGGEQDRTGQTVLNGDYSSDIQSVRVCVAPVIVTPPVVPPVVTPPVVETPTTPVQTITLIAWKMPSWIDSTTPTWPQSYQSSVVQTVANLDALDTSLPCGSQFQLDANLTGPVVTALIAGGHLDGPGNPPEALIPGGWGVAYKLIQTPACVPVPVVEHHEASTCTSITDYATRTWTTTDGVVSDDVTTPRTLDRAEAITLGCYTPPVVVCEPGTAPGWLNEFGDATSCVDDHPCIADETQDADCNPIPPVTEEPPTTTPPVVLTDLPTPPALAYTGSDPTPALGVGGALLALGVLASLAGILLKRKGAHRA